MEKVRPWCGQPSDQGRLKNRTEQNSTALAASRWQKSVSSWRSLLYILYFAIQTASHITLHNNKKGQTKTLTRVKTPYHKLKLRPYGAIQICLLLLLLLLLYFKPTSTKPQAEKLG